MFPASKKAQVSFDETKYDPTIVAIVKEFFATTDWRAPFDDQAARTNLALVLHGKLGLPMPVEVAAGELAEDMARDVSVLIAEIGGPRLANWPKGALLPEGWELAPEGLGLEANGPAPEPPVMGPEMEPAAPEIPLEAPAPDPHGQAEDPGLDIGAEPDPAPGRKRRAPSS